MNPNRYLCNFSGCGNPGVYSCSICGRLSCGAHGTAGGICRACRNAQNEREDRRSSRMGATVAMYGVGAGVLLFIIGLIVGFATHTVAVLAVGVAVIVICVIWWCAAIFFA